ncbi:MAG: dipeptidase [Phycisphaerales bacterium]
MATRWFDAHLDLAYMALNGRDMHADTAACAGPDLPAAVTLRSLAEGSVTHCLGTIFTEAGGSPQQKQCYPEGDFQAANAAGLQQLALYEAWRDDAGGEPSDAAKAKPPTFGVLIEGADPILDAADLSEWVSGGVVAIGMAWWKPSRYAGGNGTDIGLSDRGRVLAATMDGLGLVHDASHLSDRAFWELAKATDKVIVASHSNCRALVGGGGRGENQRHLHDDQIREIIKRGGIIGLNLFSKFLRPVAADDTATRATIADCLAHIEHVCDLAGDRLHVGLGSDMDGGFSALRLPQGINVPRDLQRLAEALSAEGWSDGDVEAFAFENWAGLFERFPLRL